MSEGAAIDANAMQVWRTERRCVSWRAVRGEDEVITQRRHRVVRPAWEERERVTWHDAA
jgi:hypothetical protein